MMEEATGPPGIREFVFVPGQTFSPWQLRTAQPCLWLSLQELAHTFCCFPLLSLKPTPGSKQRPENRERAKVQLLFSGGRCVHRRIDLGGDLCWSEQLGRG